MFNCFFCGWQAQNETSVFCPECGPSKNWTFEEVDQSKALQNYQKTLRSLFFQAKDFEIENISLSLRERLKISKQFHQLFLSILNKEKENINYLNQFRLEFDKNVIDAYAGHDTYLRFRFTNLSENHFYNITLHWDDPETTNEADLLIKCHHSITLGTVQSLGGSHIFPRMGIKEISDLRLKITNQFQESVIFRVTPFTFAVGSPDKFITNLTHNQTNDLNILDKNAIIKCDSSIKVKWLAHNDVNQACQKRNVEILGVEFPNNSIACNFWSRMPNHYLCEIHTSNYPTKDDVSSRIKSCEMAAGI